MANFEILKTAIDANINTNGNQKITGKVMNSVLNQMVDVTEEQYSILNDKLESLPKDDEFYKDRRYPNLSVGFADNLVGRGESIPAEFSFRASGGKSIQDGTARIKELRGNSEVWNQLVQNPSEVYTNDATTAFKAGTRIVAGHKYLFFADIESAVSYASASVFAKINEQNESLVTLYKSENLPYKFFVANANAVSNGTDQAIEGNIWLYYYLGTSDGQIQNTRLVDLTLRFGAGNEPVTIDEFYARMPIGVDMSAYNEGEVIHMAADGIKSVGDNAWDEEWRNGYYDSNGGYVYDATHVCNVNPIRVLPGEQYNISSEFIYGYIWFYDQNHILKSYRTVYGTNGASITFDIPEGIEYINFNMQPEYGATYNNDIMISLVHSGWKQDTDAGYQPYWEDRLMFDERIKDAFLEGLHKWDKVYNKNGKGYIVKGTGVADMGSLNWSRYENGKPIFQAFELQGKAQIPQYNYYPAEMICANFATKKWYDGADNGGVYQSENGIGMEMSGVLYAADSAYTDVASFKAAMAGVPLYYELATPEVIEYDEPFNFDYKVADFGTEEVISNRPSTPIAANIIYQFNAVDMIREHELEIAQLQKVIATMQTQLSSLANSNLD